jgi:hypothetical protein
MTNTVLKPAWAGSTLRLDPSRFPQQVTYALRDTSGDVVITIDSRGAVLRKTLPSSGLPLSFALPARAFKGVAARAIDHGDGEVTVTLELHHEDPELCIPLLVAHDLCDIAADWRSWSEAFRIPMLMVEGRRHRPAARKTIWAKCGRMRQGLAAVIPISLPAVRASWFVAPRESSA